MPPTSSRRRPRRPPRPSRGRNRPPQRVAISTLVRSFLIVTAVSSIAIGTYFAFSDDLSGLIGRPTEMQVPYEDNIAELRAQVDRISQLLDQKQVEQELTALSDRMNDQFFDRKRVEQQLTALEQRQATLEQLASARSGDLSATGTIKPERIAAPEATPAEKPTPASPTTETAILFAPPEREVRLQSPGLPASAKMKHHRRTAHRRASLRHRVAPPRATPPKATNAEQSPQLTRTITKPDAGLANQ